MTLSFMLYSLAVGLVVILLAYVSEEILKKSYAPGWVKRLAEIGYVVISAIVCAVCAGELLIYILEISF